MMNIKMMKAPLWLQLVRALLVTLIIIGIALLATQDKWVPQVVAGIMAHDGR